MYLNILKKDLKRKMTMNVILLMFSVLAAMFVSSGLSNVITVMNGTEYYLDKAGIGDYIVVTQNGDGGVPDVLDKSEYVKSYKTEDCYRTTKEDIKIKGKQIKAKNNMVIIQNYSKNGIKFFLTDNEELSSIKSGEVYVSVGFLEKNEASVGDTIKIDYHGMKKSYKIAGEIKDALLGSDMMGNTRLVISDEDFKEYTDNDELLPYSGNFFNIKSNNPKELANELSDIQNVLLACNRDMIKLCYVMEMIVAMIVLVLSIVLCIVSFVLLKFVITFTIGEEVREIGVMKAIGIKNGKIRSLYLTKYFVMSLIGGVIGFFAGIPFGNLLISSVSKKMVLGQDYGIIINVIGAVFVIFIMIAFAYHCTSMIKKYTPVDAIRDGQTGERFGKKSKLSLAKSKTNNAFFLAINDVASAPKRFLTIILSFFICSVFVFGVVLVVDTMKSDRLIGTFGKKSDVYITDSKLMNMELMSKDGNDTLLQRFEDMENDLEELDMPGTVSMEVWFKYPVTVNGKTSAQTFQQNKVTDTTDYDYLEGTAPENANEVAITKQIAKDLEIEIGDTITVDFGTEKRDCIIVAYFQTMNQLGSVIRLHQDAPTKMEYCSALMSYQIDFEDEVSAEDIEKRIDKLAKFYDVENIFNAAEYCDDCMGVAGTMDAVAKLLLVITCIVVILVTVLMERSFISDETSQIALLKAVGFKDSFIIKWQIYRFMIVALLSEVVAVILTYPITKLWCDPIFTMMGATNVDYLFKPLSLLLIYPGIILLINLISVWMTALYTRKITSNDVRNIE